MSAAAGCDRSPTSPGGSGASIAIEHLGTLVAAPACCERGPFTYTVSVRVRETGGVEGTLIAVSASVTDLAGAITSAPASLGDVFGATRIPANGTLLGTVAVEAPLLTTREIAVFVSVRDGRNRVTSVRAAVDARLDLTGAWAGPMPIKTDPSGDWTLARLALGQEGTRLSGTVTSRDGRSFPVDGDTVSEWAPYVVVRGLPGTSTCAGVSVVFSRFTFGTNGLQRVGGHASGRCFGTVAGTFDLDRS